MSEKKIMLGNEAIARGAYEAGVKVSAAYPGTPSTEISENIVKYPEIYAEWSPNEKVATEVAIGASISGVRGETEGATCHRRECTAGKPYRPLQAYPLLWQGRTRRCPRKQVPGH